MGKQMKGLLGEKLGMTQVFDENNRMVPVTVVAAGPCVVTQVRDVSVDGYAAVQIGYGAIDPRKVNKPETGHFAKAGVTPRRYVVELRTDDATEYTLGQELEADLFAAGQRIDCLGGGLQDVDEPLVRAHLELLSGVLVDERAANDSESLDPRGQRHGAGHYRPRPLRGFDDLLRGLVQDLVIERLQSDPDALLSHRAT